MGIQVLNADEEVVAINEKYAVSGYFVCNIIAFDAVGGVSSFVHFTEVNVASLEIF